MKNSNRHIPRWQIAMQEYRGNMTIVQKDENIHKNADVLRRLLLPNDIKNPSYVPEEASPQIPIEGISVTDLNITFFEEFNLLPELELAYKESIHASTNQTPAVPEKGWNPRLTQDYLRWDFAEINTTDSSFKLMLEKARKNAEK
ncbi:hypothetical protein O181_007631 [Austropuccinia psidii MF-1]|uniref:Uncharacterized protein n=1 Tax=Austropuccinia psidii MF-1 TaxID=1389203 RepID=A0A9Q3BN82_9BASI|nr:hypothetical protein [Austropuccinia psidii MF-1]